MRYTDHGYDEAQEARSARHQAIDLGECEQPTLRKLLADEADHDREPTAIDERDISDEQDQADYLDLLPGPPAGAPLDIRGAA